MSNPDSVEMGVLATALNGPSNIVYNANRSSNATAAGRISFVFGLQGPCVAYDTACSSAIVATHAAVRCLQSGDCDLALVAGVNVMLTPTISKAFAIAGMTSPTGRCHTFDAAADGYCRGEGCGAIVLKRKDEATADKQYGVISGVGVAQDGTSASLTAPNGRAQEKLLKSTLRDARMNGDDIDYIEAHGTGTPLGDPIEMSALAAVMGEGREDDCPLVMGAVKANIGHLEPAAGIAGIIKAILSTVMSSQAASQHAFEPFVLPWVVHSALLPSCFLYTIVSTERLFA
jgi:acyl transferase domain-containing protein